MPYDEISRHPPFWKELGKKSAANAKSAMTRYLVVCYSAMVTKNNSAANVLTRDMLNTVMVSLLITIY